MSDNDVSFKRGIPPYMLGFTCIAFGMFLLSGYSESSWYSVMTAIGVFIAVGLILNLGWLVHMGMDMKGYDNSSGGKRRIFLDKPAT